MKKLFIITISILEILIASGCAFATRIDGPYRGRVIDADTREPIEGVVVLGVWDREYPGAGGAVHQYYDAMETVTDKNGDFEIKGLGLLVMSNIIPMDVLIFKAGYEHIGRGSWKGIKRRGWKGDEESYDPVKNIKVHREVYDPKIKVKWEGDKAIIPLKKLTMEERRKNIPPPPPSEAPKEKVILMLKEMDKDLREQGMKPFREEGWR
jgi:hypothetical protein